MPGASNGVLPGENPVQAHITGKDVNAFGLHFIGTPDTKHLVESVSNAVQELLDMVFESHRGMASKATVSTEIIPAYQEFASQETILTLQGSTRGKHVYVFADPYGDAEKDKGIKLNDKLIHALFTLSTAGAGAASANIVFPLMPYSRQDQPTQGLRQPESLQIIANMFKEITGEKGYIFTLDLHSPPSKANFSGTNLLNFYVSWFLEEAMKKEGLENPVLVPSDQGGDKKISAISKILGLEHVHVIKTRDYSKVNSVDEINVFGEIEGKRLLVHDDILDTGGTLCTLLARLLEKNPESITVAITHGLFNGAAVKKLEAIIAKSNGKIKKIYVTDSVYREDLPPFVERISASQIIANNIFRIFEGIPADRNDAVDHAHIVNEKKAKKNKRKK